MHSRRSLLVSMAAMAGASPTWAIGHRAPRPRSILVLGGTGFLGPAIVRRALARGHRVTLFNRGISDPYLFPQLELILGDRDPKKLDLRGLGEFRRWDAVVDVWPNEPEIVRPTAELLMPRSNYYFFVSSIGACANLDRLRPDEHSPTKLGAAGYGGNKARSEKLLMSLSKGAAGIIRPVAIAGPRDTSFSLHYWLSKMGNAAEIVAPGDGSDPVQIVDVRDVGDWIVNCVEHSRRGIYNTGAHPVSFRRFIDACRTAVGGRAQAIWVGREFLTEQEGVKYENLPYWNPDIPGLETASTAKVERAGWSGRPFVETARAAWKSYQNMIPVAVTYPINQYGSEIGLSSVRERQIIDRWERTGAARPTLDSYWSLQRPARRSLTTVY